MKSLRKWSLALACAAFSLAPHAAFACAACSGKSDSAMAKGMNAGIFAMLGVVAFMLTAASTFFVFLARRTAAVNKQADNGHIST
jgi:hypothetical protein